MQLNNHGLVFEIQTEKVAENRSISSDEQLGQHNRSNPHGDIIVSIRLVQLYHHDNWINICSIGCTLQLCLSDIYPIKKSP